MSLRSRFTEDRGGLSLKNSTIPFYLAVAFAFIVAFNMVSDRLHPEQVAQREAIARAEKAQEAAKAAKRETDEKEYQARKAQAWADCVERNRCAGGGEPQHERAVMRDQLLRDDYQRRFGSD